MKKMGLLTLMFVFVFSLTLSSFADTSLKASTTTYSPSETLPNVQMVENHYDINAAVALSEYLKNPLSTNAYGYTFEPGVPYQVYGANFEWATEGTGLIELTASYTRGYVWSTTIGLSGTVFSANAGIDLSRQWSFDSSTSYQVPSGKVGYIRAYVMYMETDIVIKKNGVKVGTGYHLRPNGIHFVKGYY